MKKRCLKSRRALAIYRENFSYYFIKKMIHEIRLVRKNNAAMIPMTDSTRITTIGHPEL